MILLPVVAREMTSLARRKSTYLTRFVTAGAGIMVVVWMLVVSFSGVPFNELGKALFFVLSSVCFAGTLLAGAVATSDCLSEEKREGTLGLLFLTDLKSREIVLGKLAASSLNWTYALIGVVPALALALLLGGVTLGQVGLVSLVLLNTMFLSLCAGVGVSAFSKNERKAMFGCGVILFGIVFGPFLLTIFLTDSLLEAIIFPSPLYAFLSAHSVPRIGSELLVPALVLQQVFGWLFLWCASRFLPRAVNQLPHGRLNAAKAVIDEWVYGKTLQRHRHRRHLLDRNAFLWLASRERVKPQYAWVIAALAAGLYFWVFLQFPRMAFDPGLIGGLIFLIHLTLKIWVTSEVCSRLIEDRRSGALELLLSSPLTVAEIARGQTLALRRIFLKPLIVLIAGEILLGYLAYHDPANDEVRAEVFLLFAAAISTLCLDLWALKWVGLWNSLFGKSIERILVGTSLKVLLAPWLVFAGVMTAFTAVAHGMGESIDGSTTMLYWLAINLVIPGALGFAAKRSFLRHFRAVAAQRFDSRPKVLNSLTIWLNDLFGGIRGTAAVWQRMPAPVRRHPFWCAMVLSIIVVCGGFHARKQYWRGQLNSKLTAIAARNEPVRLADFARYYPPVPLQENALGVFAEAGGVNWIKRGWFADRPSLSLKKDLELRQRIEAISKANQAQLNAFLSITNYERAYVQPSLVSNLSTQTRDAYEYLRLVSAELILASHREDERQTFALLNAVIHLARICRQSPAFELQNLSVAALDLASRSLERWLRENPSSTEILEGIASELRAMARTDALADALKVDRARLIDGLNDGGLATLIGGGKPAYRFYQELRKMTGAADRQAHALLVGWARAIDVASAAPHPHRLEEIKRIEHETLDAVGTMPGRAQEIFGFGAGWYFYRDALVRAKLSTILAGIRFKRAFADTGNLPLAIAAGKNEVDFFTGRPLMHRLTPEEVMFYSAGSDRDDDGGGGGNIHGNDGDIGFCVALRLDAAEEP